MSNWTQVTHFSLGAYSEPGPLRWLYFLLILCAYVLIVGSNLLLTALISLSRGLHQPMYLLLCSLFVNEVYGSSALFPFLLYQVLQEEHSVPYSLCFLQIFCIYLYACVEIFTLAAMAYDRYLAICCPLQYHSLMTHRQVALLLCVTWLVPSLFIAVLVWLSASLPLCGNVIDKVFCGNYSIVKLACSATRLNNIYGLLYTVLSMMLPLLLILYTYGRILHVCVSAPGQARQRARLRALGTCVPHLASLINFSFGCCSQVVMSRFDVSWIPAALQVALSLYFFACQPLFNPLIYGLNLRQVRQECQRLLRGKLLTA
ncbi:olfactory receptor 11A1-like [Periophthalmus magnuspinnatus]|uniref:olfactory receptor 11A1-like n=1 Tax=Periophthalmus magnuspinnatus TaxID=409849 RepID=UPI00145ABE0D|nr:olfactory receptor 11A1-like [Periophthalmus magnuspinnatus]